MLSYMMLNHNSVLVTCICVYACGILNKKMYT